MSLVQRQASKEIVDVIAALLAEAKDPGFQGFIYVALHNGTYSADILGTAMEARFYSVGLLRQLELHLLRD